MKNSFFKKKNIARKKIQIQINKMASKIIFNYNTTKGKQQKKAPASLK